MGTDSDERGFKFVLQANNEHLAVAEQDIRLILMVLATLYLQKRIKLEEVLDRKGVQFRQPRAKIGEVD